MSRQRGVEDALRLVEDLRSAAQAFVAQAEQTRQMAELQSTRDEARRAAVEAVETERMSTDIQQLETAHRVRLETLAARHQARGARIRSAERALKKRLVEALDAEEGKRKFELQREMLRATREMEAGLAATDAARAERDRRLTEIEEALAGWDSQVRSVLAVFGEGFVRRLSTDSRVTSPDWIPDGAGDWESLLGAEFARMEARLVAWRRRLMPRVQAFWPLWLILAIAPVPLVAVLADIRPAGIGYPEAVGVSVGAVLVGWVLWLLGRSVSRSAALDLMESVARTRRVHRAAVEASIEEHRRTRTQIEDQHAAITRRVTADWNQVVVEGEVGRRERPERLADRVRRAMARNDAGYAALRSDEEKTLAATNEAIRSAGDRRLTELRRELESVQGRMRQDLADQNATRFREWEAGVVPRVEALRRLQSDPAARVSSWEEGGGWEDAPPPTSFSGALRFGWLDVDLAKLVGRPPDIVRSVPLIPQRFRLPLLLTYPEAGSMVLETRGTGRETALSTLNQIVLRLLASLPPGRADLTVVDPVGLGESFAGLMHLTDGAEHLLHGRIWTQSGQIESRLGDLCDHMEKVIQMYLRDEFATIAEYNEQAGNIAEKYRFVVVADFPSGFSDTALRRLRNIAVSGPRCGVYLLLHWDQRLAALGDVPATELRAGAVRLTARERDFIANDRDLPGMKVGLEAPPSGDSAIGFVQRVATWSRDSDRVEVPFDQVTPSERLTWSETTTKGLRVPIGRTGATKLQYLSLGQGTRQHALIAGKTGSGKSTLFHVIITNLALWCRPEEVEFYLVDFKKGVEFKCYATHRLPHARVVAIESDREFGLSVLQRLDDELRRRGDLFRRQGVQDLAGYRATSGAEVLPRVLLAIDEFQEFFVEEDKIAQSASVLLDRIVRQGRAFGVHVLLGSQTLGGSYTVARATLGQMVVRIALQCNEADAYLIMDENNPAPRLLSRPGEGIYNDAAGAREANSPFQTVWLPDTTRDAALRRIRARADAQATAYPDPVVFEGNSPADLRENRLLHEAVFGPAPASRPVGPRVWLGAPNSIKGPTEAVLDGRSGSHLLVVGQREDSSLATVIIALVALAAQHPPGSVRFFVLDGATAPGSDQRALLERAVEGIPHEVRLGRVGEAEDFLRQLGGDLGTAAEAGGETAREKAYLVVHGLQGFRRLRLEDEFAFGGGGDSEAASPAAALRQLLVEGPAQGRHVVATCDTYATVMRFLGRKALAEFGCRVLFQMSANDSASLADNPAASRLGLHRALYLQDREGWMEIFRPYALPDLAWLDDVAGAFRSRQAAVV